MTLKGQTDNGQIGKRQDAIFNIQKNGFVSGLFDTKQPWSPSRVCRPELAEQAAGGLC